MLSRRLRDRGYSKITASFLLALPNFLNSLKNKFFKRFGSYVFIGLKHFIFF